MVTRYNILFKRKVLCKPLQYILIRLKCEVITKVGLLMIYETNLHNEKLYFILSDFSFENVYFYNSSEICQNNFT